ncbi:hypothetical protein FRC12_021671 [Ceratobasidium sp. 428]|nr:hypothetical protein FRC12_021671 [Ceratobasidium sp. 428]
MNVRLQRATLRTHIAPAQQRLAHSRGYCSADVADIALDAPTYTPSQPPFVHIRFQLGIRVPGLAPVEKGGVFNYGSASEITEGLRSRVGFRDPYGAC